MATLTMYLLEEIKNPDDIEINDEFWLQPYFYFWPSPSLMKELIQVAYKTLKPIDLTF